MPDVPEGYVVHRTPARLRIKVPVKRGDKAFFSTVRHRLAQQSSVTSVEVNPATASVLIHSADSGALLRALGGEGPFTIAEHAPGAAEAPLLKQVHQQLLDLDQRVQQWTGSRHDMRVYIFLALVSSAAYQFMRGEIFAPATALLWYAGEALRLWVPSDKGQGDGSTRPEAATDIG